jgi:hypothetical protein
LNASAQNMVQNRCAWTHRGSMPTSSMISQKSGCRRWIMADSAVPSRALSDRTAFDRHLRSGTANFMGYDSPGVSSHPTGRRLSRTPPRGAGRSPGAQRRGAGSSRVMGRASGPSTRRPQAVAPMRRLRSAGAVHGQLIVRRRPGGCGATRDRPTGSQRRPRASAHRHGSAIGLERSRRPSRLQALVGPRMNSHQRRPRQ